MARGSPPRVWGRHNPPLLPVSTRRFTPTRVGKTSCALSIFFVSPVHPHACGEDARRMSGGFPAIGSPPRVWGRLTLVFVLFSIFRFTPTRVGKTCLATLPALPSSVHPHACGEDTLIFESGGAWSGSPPRVWGRLLALRTRMTPLRFTPTRVGKTIRPPSRCEQRSVHPHACGEDALGHFLTRARGGSPPRVWGRRQRPSFTLQPLRFTPTRVGKTC